MKTIAHYRILNKLGSGGMGEVFLAEDQRLGRKVAIKLLPPQFTEDESRLERFAREARTVSALNHPNILTIFDVGEEDGEHFIVAEYVDGVTLRDRLRRGPLPTSEILEIGRGIMSALAEAHAAGVVHRDIKPENVMIREDGIVKVLDFGLAKRSGLDTASESSATAVRETDPGTVLGTATYMSPEQARGLQVDGRTDLFSFGSVLYEMITGRPPFDGETKTDVLAAIIGSNPAPIARFDAEVPRELAWITEKALQKNRDERYQSAREIVADLRRLERELPQAGSAEAPPAEEWRARSGSAGEQISSGSSAEYIVTGIRRHKIAAAIVFLVVIAIAVAALIQSAKKTPIDSIAVLPFQLASGDSETAYLADGLTEGLINDLAQIKGLRVVPRSLVFSYKDSDQSIDEIASALDARAVVTGRVVRVGDKVEIQADLVDTESRSQLWGDRYSGGIDDVMTAQREITHAVSTLLRPAKDDETMQRVEKRSTNSAEAYDLYLRARYLWNQRRPDGIERSVELFREALELDPDFALAWAGLADAYGVLPSYTNAGPESLAKGKQAALKALEIDPTLAQAHAALASALFEYDQNLKAAESAYLKAIELDPDYAAARYWYSEALLADGRTAEAIEQSKVALRSDPASVIPRVSLASAHAMQGNKDQALEYLDEVETLYPGFPTIQYIRMALHLNTGDREAAEKALRSLQPSGIDARLDPLLLALEGHHAAALESAERLAGDAESSDAYRVASAFATAGASERALEWLERAADYRDPQLMHLRRDPSLWPLYDDPGFQAFVDRLGLSPLELRPQAVRYWE